MNITEAIIKTRDQFLKDNPQIKLISDINKGYCLEFAEDIEKIIPEIEILEIANFTNQHKTNLNNEWAKNEKNQYICDLYNDSFDKNLDPEKFNYHFWIYYKGKHYDSESPEGFLNFTDLSIFK